MPIKIPSDLPAKVVLEQENIFVMPEDRAIIQDIRPLRILIFNLMPNKIVTETQLLRLLGNSALQIEVDFLSTASYKSTNTSEEHIGKFYQTFDEVAGNRYDGMIITGAPVEKMEFEEVNYWQELESIMKWSETHVYSVLHICWAAQAALYYYYDVPKYLLPEKKFGVFTHTLADVANDKLFRGFDDVFYVPHARHTEVRKQDILKHEDLKILADSQEAGVFAVVGRQGRQFFVFGHPEYDVMSLHDEYMRDVDLGLDVPVPVNYYPGDDRNTRPRMCWRSTAHLLFSNWLNYYVYQDTPYDLNNLDK